MRMTSRIIAAAVFVVLAVATASAQAQTVRVRGTVAAVDGQMLTVKARDGAGVTIKMADNVSVVALVKASLADIKPGSFVGSTAMPEADGRWKAVEVHIFPEAQRGTGEGDRPFDYRPKSTMTNGTVGAVGGGASGATVDKAEGKMLTLNFKDGEKKIDVTPDTIIYTYAPGSKDELKAGATVIVTATRQADGALTTARINVGRDIVPPM